MRERPILFSGPMVRAILAGQKTQTRRIAKAPKGWSEYSHCDPFAMPPAVWWWNGEHNRVGVRQECPYGKTGDCLWVRETWARPTTLDPGPTIYRADYPACVPSCYENVPPADDVVWKPSIHMLRSACRITLEITGVRVERLQEISDADCMAEGIDQCDGLGSASEVLDLARRLGTFSDPLLRYATLWEQINGTGAWGANPWVWVVEFRRIES